MKRITDFDAGDVFKIKQSDQKIPNFKQIPLRKYFEKKMEDKFLVDMFQTYNRNVKYCGRLSFYKILFRKTAYFDKNPEYNRNSGIEIPTWYNLITGKCNNMQKSEVRRVKWSLSNVIYI